MKVEDSGNCARPILFENDDEDFTYSVGGTGFLVVYGGRLFGVTAAHVISNHQSTAESVRIPPTLDNPRVFLPFRRIVGIHPRTATNADHQDVILYGIDQTQLGPFNMDSLGAYDLACDRYTPLSLYEGAKLLLRGYPVCAVTFDLQKRYIGFKALTITGNYRERAGLDPHCHLFAYDGLMDVVSSANGMSGSPVFQVESRPKVSLARLAGMLTKGDDAQNIGYFIDVSVLTAMLRQALGGKTSPQ